MSYKNPDKFIFEDGGDPEEFLEDIISRKEFAMYSSELVTRTKISSARKYLKDKKFDLNEEIKRGNYLFLHSYQQFIVNIMNPSTDFNRILVGWQAGSGKTLPPLKIGINMLDAQIHAKPENMGNVIILGFTQSTFKKELLKYPELGFLSREEYDEYQVMYHRSLEGSQLDQELLREFLLKIKRRMTNKSTHRARFVFMGYKQFANKLFLKNPKYETMFLGDIEKSDITSSDPTKQSTESVQEKFEGFSIHELNEEQMNIAITEGKVIVNEELLSQFRNSFLVCDEIHKVYNSEEQNHWGVAISYILNYPNINLKVMYLSATPMNNHHTEIVDLLNMLLPPPHNKIRKSDLFVEPSYAELRPGALDLIGKLTAGRVSFLQDQDPRYYPQQLWEGEKLPGVDILKFVRCPMSEFHYNTYKQVYNGTLSQESLYLVDFALPNPSGSIGMYQTSQIVHELEKASEEWKEKNGLYWQNGMLTGTMLTRQNIGKYSSKYAKLLDIVTSIVKRGGEKAFIYHDAVHVSGVLFIQELLKYNGFIDESSASSADTLCVVCGNPKKMHLYTSEEQAKLATENEEVQLTNLVQVLESIEHDGGGKSGKIKNHTFVAARFMIAHSDMDKALLSRNMEKYNSPENMHGHYILFIVGSQLMRESHDMKHLRHEIVVYLSGGLPALVQIFGRGVRNSSHRGAPANEWNVKRYIIVTSLPVGIKGFSYEEERYIRKINVYKIIQKIEKTMHEYAIDAALNYSKISRVIAHADSLSILPYKPRVTDYKTLNTSTYKILYAEHEINTLVGLIKRVFIEWNPIWQFEDLWNFISDPFSPISKDVNFQVQMLSKEYFTVALTRLITPQVVSAEQKTNILDKTFDPNDRVVSVKGDAVIEHIGKYYMLVPFDKSAKIDVESPFRYTESRKTSQRISLDDVMEKNAPTLEEEFDLFVYEHKPDSFESLNNILCLYTLEFHEFILRKIIPAINLAITKRQKIKKDEMVFYVRLLYQYHMSGVVIWASSPDLTGQYAKWTKPDCSLLPTKDCNKVYTPNVKCSWCPSGILAKYAHYIGTTISAIENNKKVSADMLPVGYMLRSGFLYGANGWMDYQPTLIDSKENDIIVGYDERADDDIVVKFKLRNPKHKITKHKDIRKIEKGTACSSKNKEYLLQLAKQIEAPYDHTNVHSLCTSIRDRLLYLENIEKQKPAEKRIRWFYYVHELHD